MAAKGPGVTAPGDQSDGGAADTSADMGEHGTDLPGERRQSANQCDCDGGGHPDSFHLILQEVFCFLSASNTWKVTQKYISTPKIQMGHTKLLLPLDGLLFADWCHVFGKSYLWPFFKSWRSWLLPSCNHICVQGAPSALLQEADFL